MVPVLACGPFFSQEGVYASIFVLLAVKPLTYVAFVQAFRYRVSSPQPMTPKRAVVIAGVRAVVGLVLVAALYATLAIAGPGEWLSWSALMAERAVAWLVIGRCLAHLRGRRLAGWTISGTAIDAAYDAAIGASLLVGWAPHAIAGAAIALFVAGLTVVGRRRALKARFNQGAPACLRCAYDLTGNRSGICPECGAQASRAAA